MSILIQLILNTFIYLAVILLLFNLLLIRKQRSGFSYVLFLGICIAASCISYIYDWFSIVRTSVMILGALFFFYRGTVPNKILASALIVQLGVVLDFLHGIVLMLSLPDLEYIDLSGGIPTWDSLLEILVIITLIALNFFRREKEPLVQYFDKKYVLVWILITLNFLLFASVLTSLEFSNQMKGIISAILILTSGINIYFCYYLEKTRKIFEENLIITKQIEFQKNKLAQNKAYLEKNNRLMHDIKKHYLEIEQALSENQLVYVKEYMKGVYKQYFENVESGFTGNQVIDSMFFSLKEQCEKEEIDLTCEILIDKKITFHDQDLAVLLGSLFDRAIKTMKSKEKIMVTLKTEVQHLLIAIDYPRNRQLPNTGITKKTVEQWEDIQVVHRIVEKYHGMYETKNDSEKSGIKILLPLR